MLNPPEYAILYKIAFWKEGIRTVRKKNLLLLMMLFLLFLPCGRVQAALIKPKILTVKSEYEKITLTWREVPGATHYNIFRKGGGKEYKRIALLPASAGLSYEDTGLKPGISYTYTMKAMRFAAGKEKLISELAKEVTTVTKIPEVTLGSAEAGNKDITISWEKIPGASGYRIYRREGTGDYKMLADVDRAVRTYRDRSVSSGVPYRYTVRAYVKEKDEIRLGLKNNTSIQAKLELPVPELSGQAASGRVRLDWKTQTGIDGYRIYRRLTGTVKKYKLVTTVKHITRFYHWDSSVVPGKNYEYVIRSFVMRNGIRYYSKASNTVQLVCLPGNVIPLSLTREGSRDVLKWQRVKGCSSYIIYKKNAETNWKWLRTAVVKANQTQKKFNRTAGTTYYTVRARVQAGEEMLLSPRYFALDNAERKYTQQKALFAGDSITWGFCWNGKRTPVKVTFPKRVVQLTGMSADIYGFPGESVAQTNGIRIARSLILKKVDYAKYSLIVLEGGTNDYGRSVPIGTLYDTNDDTFYGSWNDWLTQIREVNPDAKIVLVLPLFRQRIWYDFFPDARVVKNSAGYTLSQYADAMKKIARRYGAEVFDANKAGALTAKDSVLLKDAAHPTEEAHIQIGDALAEMLKSILPRDSAKPSEGNKQKPAESEPEKPSETETVKPTAAENQGDPTLAAAPESPAAPAESPAATDGETEAAPEETAAAAAGE